MSNDLNSRQEMFAQLVASGKSASAAYREVYGASPESAEANAYRLMENDGVLERIRELQGATAKEVVLTLEAKRRMMKTIAEDQSLPLRDRLKAVELDAKLAGEFSEKQQVDLTHRGMVVTPDDLAAAHAATIARLAELNARDRCSYCRQ